MALEVDIHPAQTEILRVLLFTPAAPFSVLQKESNLESDHFSFHLKKLLELKMIEKSDKQYSLTTKGKEYANRLDTDERTIEKQPKSGVLLVVTRQNDDGETEYLFQQRLKQPFYGFYMFPTGKIRWGESFEETARRELDEETNLNGDFKLIGITHKRDYEEDSGKLLEDKIFYNMHCKNSDGDLIDEFEGGKNFWMTKDEFYKQDKVMKGPETVFEHLETPDLTLFEEKFYFSSEEY